MTRVEYRWFGALYPPPDVAANDLDYAHIGSRIHGDANGQASVGALPTVVIADDHRLVAECLAERLSASYDVVAIALTLDEVLPAIIRTAPDAVVLDLSFGRNSALPVIPAIRQALPGVYIVVVTMHAEPALAEACRAAGAHHHIVKTQGMTEVLEALAAMRQPRPSGTGDAAANAQPHNSPHLRTVANKRHVGGVSLSKRQFDILLRLSVGATRSAVAAELGISAKGVDYNLNQVRRLLGVRRMINVVAWFRDAVAADGGGRGRQPEVRAPLDIARADPPTA